PLPTAARAHPVAVDRVPPVLVMASVLVDEAAAPSRARHVVAAVAVHRADLPEFGASSGRRSSVVRWRWRWRCTVVRRWRLSIFGGNCAVFDDDTSVGRRWRYDATACAARRSGHRYARQARAAVRSRGAGATGTDADAAADERRHGGLPSERGI